MNTAAIIVAAGRGLRAGGGLPKQYRTLCGTPMLRLTANALLSDRRINAVQIVIADGDAALYDQAMDGLNDPRMEPPCLGGATRAGSVVAGLRALQGLNPDHVFIHDAARPFLNSEILDGLFQALKTADGAFPAIPVVDALWYVDGGKAVRSQPRDALMRAQTPQAFDYAKLLRAFDAADPEAADDVAVARAAGLAIAVCQGAQENFKVTTSEDFAKAEARLSALPDIRTGNGYDVHRFGDGDHVILCGVKIPFDRGLAGHSDADVGLHTLTDAIFGALAKGDIGQWFPPSDPQWKGAASDIFLRKAVEVAREDGFEITHLDCTLICEAPKIGPHAQDMRIKIAEITGIAVERISVKATTTERLGFTGRSEGIAAQATATLVRP